MGGVGRLASALADRYTIQRELGAGGMATVYLAHDIKHGRKVAVKVLRPELAAVIGAERFLAEIRTTANLQHPHILPLFDSGAVRLGQPEHGDPDDGEVEGPRSVLFYVMPFVQGESLRDRLTREKQLPIGDAVRIASEMASALDYAHRHGVIHRDIKPENVMLHDGSALVADFGIAIAASTAGNRMTETGMSLGTPQYMSPEQAMGERELDARSDIYALGCVTFEMLAGEPPFSGPTAQAIVAKIMTADAPELTTLRRTVPPHVADAVHVALQKLPADRFESAKGFADALGTPGVAGRRSAAGRAVTAPTRRLAAWLANPWSWGMAAIVAALLLVMLTQRRAAGTLTDVRFTQQTYRPEAIFTARFAPDGKTVVFSSTGASGTVPHLYVIRPDYPEPQPLGPDSTHLLAISSTGTLAVLTGAVYANHRLFEGTLASLPLGPGAPRALLAGVREADWSPDGKTLAIIHRVDDEDRVEYPIGTVLARSAGYFSDIRVSPTGDQVALFDHQALYDDRGTVVILGRNGAVLARSPVHWALEGLAWSREPDRVMYTGSTATNGSYTALTAYSMDLHGRMQLALASAGGITLQDISASNRWLVTHDDLPYRLLVGGPEPDHERDLSWLDVSETPVISADGKLVAFADQGVTGGLNYGLLLRKTDGSPAARLGDGEPMALSRDGQSVLAIVPSVPPRLMIYPTGPGEPRRLDQGQFETISYVTGQFVDDQRVFMCGSQAGHSVRCYIATTAGGTFTPVTPEGTLQAALSPDGTRIAAQVRDSFVLIAVAGGPSQPARGLRPHDHLVRWSPDGRELWVWRPGDLAVRVERVNPATGQRSPLIDIAPPGRAGVRQYQYLRLADDGRTYAVIALGYASTLFVVDGVR